MAAHDADYEHRIRVLEETCAACKARRKRARKRKIGIVYDTDARGSSLDGQTSTYAQDPDPADEPEDRGRR